MNIVTPLNKKDWNCFNVEVGGEKSDTSRITRIILQTVRA